MVSNHIKHINIKNFRGFKDLDVRELAQFNLIVGDNNVGKTSFLESLVFDENNFSINAIRFITTLCIRKLHFHPSQNKEVYKVNALSYIFKNKLSYKIEYANNEIKNLEFEVINKESIPKDILEKDISFLHSKDFEYSDFFLKQTLDNELQQVRSIYSQGNIYHHNYLPFIAFGVNYGSDLIMFLKTLKESKEAERKVINLLKFILPNIESLEILPFYSYSNMNTSNIIIVRQYGIDNPMPLASFGDGFSKVIRVLLEIVKSSGKRLMIDEIDTGLHYSKQLDFFKAIFKYALEYKVQLFFTTHNMECIEFFKQALYDINQKAEGRIISLQKNKDGIVKAFTYTYEAFETNLELENEIR